MQSTVSNDKTLVSETPNIMKKMLLLHQGSEKKPVSILSNKFCEEQAFPHLLPKGKFAYSAPRVIPISPAWYYNQWLLNFKQYLASDADCIFLARSVYEQHHLRSTINFAKHKIKPGTFTTGTVKNNFKGTIKRFVASDNAFSFMSSAKGTPAYWKDFI